MPKSLFEIETNSQEGTTGLFKEYYELISKMFAYFKKIVQNRG